MRSEGHTRATASLTSQRRNVSRLVLLALLALLLLSPDAPRAQAQGGFATATAPAPIAGTGAVVFVSQSVDATLSRAEDGLYWIDAEGSIRLHNTDRFRTASVSLGWPGWPGGTLRFEPTELPGFVPVKGGVALGTELQTIPTTWGGETRDSNWLVTRTTISPDTRDRLFLNWRQALGSGSLLTYSFGLLPAGAWNGTVGSARITLDLPAFASEEIIVHAEPLSYTFTGNSIEWILVEEEPTVNPTVTFIAPHIWQEIETARATLVAEPLAANLRLAELYEQVAAAGVPAYSAEAEATLEAARRAAPDNPDPLRRLATLYRARAEREGGNLATLEQAVAAAEAALAAGATDPETRQPLVTDLQTLAAAWAEQDPAVALDFLERAEAAGGDPATLAAVRRPLAEAQALAALQRGEVASARALAAEYGLPTEEALFPWLASAAVRVENGAGGRVVSLFATGDPAQLEEQLGGLAARLNVGGYPATWDAATGTLTVRLLGYDRAWTRGGLMVASALGEGTEWELLRQALAPAYLEYRLQPDLLEQHYGYREEVRLELGAADRAAQLRTDATGRDSPWERALLEAAAEQWQALADSQSLRVTTRFAVAGGTVQRDWTLTPPTTETLEWRGDAVRRDRWLLVGIVGAVGLLLVLALIWLPGQRRAAQE